MNENNLDVQIIEKKNLLISLTMIIAKEPYLVIFKIIKT